MCIHTHVSARMHTHTHSAQLVVSAMQCSTSCTSSFRNNGACDIPCMSASCNWDDGEPKTSRAPPSLYTLPSYDLRSPNPALATRILAGDCNFLFRMAGQHALRPCECSSPHVFGSDRVSGGCLSPSDEFTDLAETGQFGVCFHASCDWLPWKLGCGPARQGPAKCVCGCGFGGGWGCCCMLFICIPLSPTGAASEA